MDFMKELESGILDEKLGLVQDFNEEEETWFTTIKPLVLYINFEHFKNHEPLLVTTEELYKSTKIKGAAEVDELFSENRDECIKRLNENGIAVELLCMKLKERVLAELTSYFEHGQYTKYQELNRASRPCLTPRILNSLIKNHNMGAADLGYHNLGFILKIPSKCFDREDPIPLYKYTESMIIGTYMGIEELHRVIPREYIKEGIYRCGDEIIRFPNPYYDKDYRLPHSDDSFLYEGVFNSHGKKR